MTIEHSDIGAGEIHEPKGVSTASSGEVYVADGAGSGEWRAETAANEVIVNSIDDFPAPVAGVITLAGDTIYKVAAAITTSNRFVMGSNTKITAFNTFSPTFSYTGTGTMFTGTDVSCSIQDIYMTCPNGTVFDFSDPTTPNTHVFIFRDSFIIGCQKIGNFDSLATIIVDEVGHINATQGYTITGTGWRVWRVQNSGMLSTNPSFIGFDLGTATCVSVNFGPLLIDMVSGGVAFSGAANSANLAAGDLGRIEGVTLTTSGTMLSGLTTDDIRWAFANNDEIQDTMPDAFVGFNGNATETTIAVAGTPVLVAGTWVEQEVSQFTTTAAGRITYNGERAIKAPILASLSCRMASGSDTDVTFYLYKNGVQLAASAQGNTVKAAAVGNTSLIYQDTIEENDYYEIYIANEDSTINIVVEDAKFLIN